MQPADVIGFVHVEATCLTWVGNRGDSDFVVGFTGAEACDHILNPPQLFSDLDFFLLLTEKHTETFSLTHTVKLLVYPGSVLPVKKSSILPKYSF